MKLPRLFSGVLKRYCTQIDGVNSPSVTKDIKVGDEVSISKTITSGDVIAFATLTGDYNPIHIDPPRLVHGALLNGLVSGVLGTKLPGPGTIVLQQSFSFPKPCYTGDTVVIKIQIISARKIIKCEYTCVANGERTVLKGEAKLIKKQ